MSSFSEVDSPPQAGNVLFLMQEYEIYLPTQHNDGKPVDPSHIQRIEDELAKHFGGYTHLKQHSDGFWSVGKVTFRDSVTIVRVLDDGLPRTRGQKPFDMLAFKREIELTLQQESILVVAREVRVL